MTKSKSPQPPAPPATNIQIVCQEPIIVSRDSAPMEETPLPAENTSWSRLILFVGATAVLLFFPWLDPAQIQTLWQGFIQQLLQSLKLP